MKCPGCGYDNKEGIKLCKKCGRDLTVSPPWFPDYKWHLKTLGIIYAVTAVFYFIATAALKKLPKPYDIRHVPPEMTPWLGPDGKNFVPEEQLKAPGEKLGTGTDKKQ